MFALSGGKQPGDFVFFLIIHFFATVRFLKNPTQNQADPVAIWAHWGTVRKKGRKKKKKSHWCLLHEKQEEHPSRKTEKQENAWTQSAAAAETPCSACKCQISQVLPQQKSWGFPLHISLLSFFLLKFLFLMEDREKRAAGKTQWQDELICGCSGLKTQGKKKEKNAAVWKVGFKLLLAKLG